MNLILNGEPETCEVCLLFIISSNSFIQHLIQSIRDNPRATIFTEPLGVVTFDESFAKYIKDINKEKEKFHVII